MMAEPQEYDVVVLGSGEAGGYLAWTLASEGKRAALVERKYLGGSCPNIACLPSKNFIHSAKVARTEVQTSGTGHGPSARRQRRASLMCGCKRSEATDIEVSNALRPACRPP
jgi:pyruvate/2-oxoglutarate dehydrogenase complex dihydrolipoamide dehydrogenase (E3) component